MTGNATFYMQNKRNLTVVKVPKSNREIIETRGKMDTPICRVIGGCVAKGNRWLCG